MALVKLGSFIISLNRGFCLFNSFQIFWFGQFYGEYVLKKSPELNGLDPTFSTWIAIGWYFSAKGKTGP